MSDLPRFRAAVVPPKEPSGDALWFAFSGSEMLVAERGEGASHPLGAPCASALSALGLWPLRTQYLGTLDGKDSYAAELAVPVEPPPGHRLMDLRRLYNKLDPAEFHVAGVAFQIQYWDRSYRYCPACATPLELKEKERAKRCQRCAHDYYPRVTPATITLVHDGPRVLLTRQPRFPPGMYGLVAGFVEPGETFEECVAREVREETGLEVDGIEYFGSQPWPFPHQVMVGFMARYAGGEIQVDTAELEDARWFEATKMPQLPPKISIARALLDTWLARLASH